MTIQDLYNQIKNNNVTTNLIIFKNQKTTNFLANQYIAEIAKQHELQISYIDSLDDIPRGTSIFDTYKVPCLYVYNIDKFDLEASELLSIQNLIISCKTISKKAENLFNDYIISVPALEDWQVKDFVYSNLTGMKETNLDQLVELCSYNIDYLQQEVNRLIIFPEAERNLMYEACYNAGIYNNLTTNTIFDFIKAITTRNKEAVSTLYPQICNMDSSEMGILALLYDNFKSIILLQYNLNADPTTVGMAPGKFYAIKHILNYYTKEQLIKIFLLISDIDRQIKTGELEIKYIVDYILVNIFAN